MLTATAAEIVETDQPNSACSGSIRTPGTARNPAAPTRPRKVTAAPHHAGWIRRRSTLSSLTQPSLPQPGPPGTIVAETVAHPSVRSRGRSCAGGQRPLRGEQESARVERRGHDQQAGEAEQQ